MGPNYREINFTLRKFYGDCDESDENFCRQLLRLQRCNCRRESWKLEAHEADRQRACSTGGVLSDEQEQEQGQRAARRNFESKNPDSLTQIP
jgi:hypothetical protein